MDLSVVIVNWNGGRDLRRLILSLAPLRTELAQILVADNASSDSSLEPLRNEPDLHFLEFATNRGFAAAANAAISRCNTSVVLLLNPDVEVMASSIRSLYTEMRGRPDAAIVCGPLRDGRGREQRDFQIRPLPSTWSILKDVLFLDHLRGRSKPESHLHGPTNGSAQRVEQPAAAFWMVRKEVWNALGGFDEQFYPAWFEDVDFCKRLRKTEWNILFFSDCPVVHRGGHSRRHLGYKKFCRIYYGNLLKYVRKHHRCGYLWLWLPIKLGAWARRWLLSET
ncbi:MAG: glycosyltransferase family 2 protein [Acidobacteriota bacterium]